MEKMENGRFEGWYFKHQEGNNTIAFIPGTSSSGAFIQMLSPDGTQYFRVPNISVEGDKIKAGRCIFTPMGCKIDLPGVVGKVVYKNLTPLATDIMGPFRFFPMKCRHGVISMAHSLRGSITTHGKFYSFDNGMGYIEKDSGISFPSSYQWIQCNIFPEPCSIMISIAQVPFLGFHFTGCICAVIFRGHEYRLATYKGVKILSADENHIYLSQGNLKLKTEILSYNNGYLLRAPVVGRMTNTISERANAKIHFRLWERGRLLLNLYSPYAAYEYVPPAKTDSETTNRSD